MNSMTQDMLKNVKLSFKNNNQKTSSDKAKKFQQKTLKIKWLIGIEIL